MIRVVFMCAVMVAFLTSGCIVSEETADEGPEMKLGTTALSYGQDVSHHTVSISNAGGGTLTWRIEVDAEDRWVQVNPSTGEGNADITVTVDRAQLTAGEHTAVLSVRSNGGDTVISLHLVVAENGMIIIDGDVPPPEGQL